MNATEYKEKQLAAARTSSSEPDVLETNLKYLKADYELWIQHPTDQFLESILDRCKQLIKIYEDHTIQR